VVAPESSTLLLSESLHCLHMYNSVSYLRLLAMAVAPESPTLLLSESLHCLRIHKVVRCLRFYATNCAPLSPIAKYSNQSIPIPLILSSFTCGSCMSSTVSFDIVLSDSSTFVNPLTVKKLLSPSAFSAALPRCSSVSC
jgi:hypothetical protein